MGSFVKFDGGGKLLDVEYGVVTFSGTDTSVVARTDLSTILHSNVSAVAGSNAPSAVIEIPSLNHAINGTATGTSAGVQLGGTTLTFVRSATAAGNVSYSFQYRIEGES